jgi:hypothetical protein
MVVAALTVWYAYSAAKGAQERRNQPHKTGSSATTAALALVAFLVWWVATPGTWLTADEDISSFYVALGLVVVVAALPSVAKALRVEPLR